MNGESAEVEIDGDSVRIDGAPVDVELIVAGGSSVARLAIDGTSYRVVGRRVSSERWEIHLDGQPSDVQVMDERARRARLMGATEASASGPDPMRAPMPGLVLSVDVEEGQDVSPGQGLVIVEAMKMENELRAGAVGRVARIHIAAGHKVEKGDVLIEFEEHDEVTDTDGEVTTS